MEARRKTSYCNGPLHLHLQYFVRPITLFEHGSDAPEISIHFEDRTNFNFCFGVETSLEAKLIRDDGDQPLMLKDYIPLGIE